MSKTFVLVGFVLLLVSINPVSGQPKLPYKDYEAAPCEYCQYGEWTARKETVIFKTMNPNSPIAFRVKPQERVFATTGVVITTKAGLGKALKNTFLEYYDEKNYRQIKIRIKKNENFYLLTYQGEDFYTVWFKGRLLYISFSNAHLRKISFPKSVWWVKVRNSKGQIGWTKMARNFDGEHPY